MAKWFYYNEDREKLGPITGKELKQLALQGTITPENFVEDPNGRTGLAKDVKGLTFAELIPSESSPSVLDVSLTPGNLSDDVFEMAMNDALSATPPDVSIQHLSFCTNCGDPVSERAVACMSCGAKAVGHRNFCHQCGAALNPVQIVCVECGFSIDSMRVTRSCKRGTPPKNKLVAFIFAFFFFGHFGSHWFYLGE
jgi:hypothetical protein